MTSCAATGSGCSRSPEGSGFGARVRMRQAGHDIYAWMLEHTLESDQ